MLHLFRRLKERHPGRSASLCSLRVAAFVDICNQKLAHDSHRYIIYHCTT